MVFPLIWDCADTQPGKAWLLSFDYIISEADRCSKKILGLFEYRASRLKRV